MDGDPRVRQLLEELLDSEHTPEDVCRHCPELLPQVRERWRRKLACDAHLDALFPAPGTGSASVPSPAGMPPIPGYEVGELLGRGGMGVVYRARHVRLNRPVALKMLLTGVHAGSESRGRFLREAEAVAGLRHPNIVQVYDMGDLDGQPYFTMEFVEGGNLAQKLAGMPQPPRQAAALLATLAGAVHAAHRGGIVHRDLKPSNVLLTADGTPKISDFGLARRLDGEARLTWTGTAVGTPGYMAPEQAEAGPLAPGTSVDVYALGAILYELLTGRPPLRAATAEGTVRRATSREILPPSRLNGKVPRDLETICLKCLHDEPHLRYAGGADLAADLHRFLDGEAIAARPDGRVARLARRVRRRPVHAAVTAAGTLSAVALLGGGLWLISDRMAAARKVEADRVATERAAGEDLREMGRRLEASSWPDARAAMERARGRLGDRGSAELDRLLVRGARELELVSRLEAIRMDVARGLQGFVLPRTGELYETAFLGAGIGRVDDDPEGVAGRVRASNIRNALVDALDDWSGFADSPRRRDWVLAVAREADPAPTPWRDRARDPAIRANQAILVEVIKDAPVSDQSVPLLLALDRRLNPGSKERLPFLKRVHRAHPGDFWVNHAVGDVLLREGKPEEAIGYFQSAASIRPRTALSHHLLGYALLATGRTEESVRNLRLATDIEPTYILSHQIFVSVLTELARHDEAIDNLQVAIGRNPDVASLRTGLGRSLEARGRHAEALAQHRQALALDPKNSDAQQGLRNILARSGRGDEARLAWKAALEDRSARPDDWYGYAEFCLYIGQEEEYRLARRALLATFGTSTDPAVAELTARACLLLPATAEELRQVEALAEQARAVDRSGNPGAYPSAMFVQGLAEYRRGTLDRAISTLRGDASRMPGPAPALVLALALHRRGQVAEARKTLAGAVVAHDWRAIRVRDPNDWFLHTLRREAERTILPDLPAFLAGTHQPRDNDERLALLGVCQFTNRAHALARLYADAFAAAPRVAQDVGPEHRYSAARSAALAGCGRAEDGKDLGEEERRRWRRQAHDWLRLELAAWGRTLDGGMAADRHQAWRHLTYWLSDPLMAGVREPGELEILPDAERDSWLALWKEVEALVNRSAGA